MNLYRQFLALNPAPPLQVGTITTLDGAGLATVTLPGGGTLQARGATSGMQVGAKVFVRNGTIEGEAPALTDVLIEI